MSKDKNRLQRARPVVPISQEEIFFLFDFTVTRAIGALDLAVGVNHLKQWK